MDEELLGVKDTSSVSLRLPPSPTGEGYFYSATIGRLFKFVGRYQGIALQFGNVGDDLPGVPQNERFMILVDCENLFVLGTGRRGNEVATR